MIDEQVFQKLGGAAEKVDIFWLRGSSRKAGCLGVWNRRAADEGRGGRYQPEIKTRQNKKKKKKEKQKVDESRSSQLLVVGSFIVERESAQCT